MSQSELLRRTIRPDRQNRTHRPHPDLRRATPADRPCSVQRPLQRPAATSIAESPPTEPRSCRAGPCLPANQTPTRPGRPHQRVRTRGLKLQVKACNRILEPDRVPLRPTRCDTPAAPRRHPRSRVTPPTDDRLALLQPAGTRITTAAAPATLRMRRRHHAESVGSPRALRHPTTGREDRRGRNRGERWR
jgi:hypothetical protein